MNKKRRSIDYRTILDGVLSGENSYRQRILKNAPEMGLRTEAAEEALAEAVYRMTRNTDLKRDIEERLRAGTLSVDGASEVLTEYLRKTIRNLTIDEVRKKKKRLEWLVEMPIDTRHVERDRSRRIKELIQEALDILGDHDRTILRLAHFEEMPMKEIAEMLDVSPATAYRRKGAAEQHLLDIVLRLLDAEAAG